MAAAHVQACNASNDGFASSITTTAFGASTTAGNAIVVIVTWDHEAAAAFIGFSDSKGNTYTTISTPFTDSHNQSIVVGYSLNIANAGASHTVTATMTGGSGQFFRIVAHEVSGLLSSGAFDQSTYNANTASSTPTAASLTPTTGGQYIFAGVTNDGGTASQTYSAGGSATEPANSTAAPAANEMMAEYYVQPTAAAIAMSWTRSGSGDNLWGVATFKAVGGGVAAPKSSMLMMGI